MKMDVSEAIRTRRSIRKYRSKSVAKKKLMRILESVRLSPSAVNFQPWTFIAITDPEMKQKLRPAYGGDWLISAPVIIVACALLDKAWTKFDGEEYWKVDVAIAMQTLVLAAWEEGLGTCWIGAFNEEEAKKALDIPPNVRIVAMTPLGYPAEEKGPVTDRKPLEEIVKYEHW